MDLVPAEQMRENPLGTYLDIFVPDAFPFPWGRVGFDGLLAMEWEFNLEE
jgi:hypothetical protein